jgi:hypothetical protein
MNNRFPHYFEMEYNPEKVGLIASSLAEIFGMCCPSRWTFDIFTSQDKVIFYFVNEEDAVMAKMLVG